MAAPSQTRNLWLTLGAAAATLVIVGGVLAGPALLACYGSDTGFAACLRQEIVQAGLLPRAEPVEAVVEAPTAPEIVAEEPKLTLLRAEPDGSFIVAGTGKPGISVQVFANGIVVGEAVAEATGDWVIIPEKPLVTGSAEITVGISGSNERSGQAFVVTIQPDGVSEPTVVVSEPVEAPPPPEPAPEPIVEPQPEAAPASRSFTPQPAPTEPERIAREPIIVADVPAQTVPRAPQVVVPAPAEKTTIDAIEIDGEANFFAGAGVEGATVRLYVESRFVAEARVEGGRWLVEARGALKLPKQRVRIDMLRPQSAEVSARAEVDFVIDVPGEPMPPVDLSGSASGGLGSLAILEVAVDDPEIPTLRAIPGGDPEKLRFASGKAIIRRGESLWGIARRVYGDGGKYLAIFDANRDQMRSPAEIYPGQVFNLPPLQEDSPVN